MTVLTHYPWIEPLYASLVDSHIRSKLPHAVLLTGIDGIGKLALARVFGNLLLCQDVRAKEAPAVMSPCGRCHACGLFEAGHHPDYLFLEPEKKDANILVDQVRRVTEFVALKSHLGGMQVVIINQAHRMNRHAANSLLKTLEEPTAEVLLVLISSQPDRLPATIKSRCQVRVMDVPGQEIALQWLQHSVDDASLISRGLISHENAAIALRLSHGAPILARTYLADGVVQRYHDQLGHFLALSSGQISVVDIAAKWIADDVRLSVQWLFYWVSRLICIKFGMAHADTGKDEQQLQNLSVAVDLTRLYGFYDKLLKTVPLLDTQVNLQLLAEDLLLAWKQSAGGQR